MGKTQKQAVQGFVDLTPEEVKHLARPREGFEAYVDGLLEVYRASGKSWPITIDADAILADVQAGPALDSSIEETRLALELKVKTRAMRRSKAWRGSLLIYKWAELAGETDPDIKRAISRFEHFMKLAPRKVVAPVKPAPGAA